MNVDRARASAYIRFSRRDVAQPGSALEWGSRGRRFKSSHPDQELQGLTRDRESFFRRGID